MDEVLDTLAHQLGVAALTEQEATLLLDCAREVAHASQRRHAPLTTFLLGVAAQQMGGDRRTALESAARSVRDSLSDLPPAGSPDQPEH